MLPETRVGSYKASHLWGGVWASIDLREREREGERAKGRGRRGREIEVGRRQRDQPWLMNFPLFNLK